MPTQPHKFEKGEPVSTVAAAAIHIMNDGWLYFRDQLQHPAWSINWSLAFLRQQTRAGRIFYAVRAEE